MSGEPTGSLSFEDALGRLEALTAEVEGGSMPLAKALDEFERGIQLAQHCRKILDAAEGRVKKLTESGALEELEAADEP